MKWLGPLVVVLVALGAELALGRAASGPDLALFLGRFHPLIVHLPIGFFLLVALAEGATLVPKLRDRVEPALGLLIPLSAIAAVAAFCLGQLLALEGGFPSAALTWHRRLTLLAVVGMSACWVLYDRQRPQGNRLAYRGALVATLGVLSLGAHFGGTMTRGEAYLSKYAPEPLKPLLGTAEPSSAKPKAAATAGPAAAEPLLYDDVVQRTLNNYCFECHGTEKQKGKLRIDSLELLLKGGESGPAVVPGDAKKSPLVSRMLLPVADDDHMPPEGKPAPKPEELALIQFWIERGASPTLKVRDVLAPSVSRSLLEHTLGIAPASDSVPVSAPAAPTPSAEPTTAAPEPSPTARPTSVSSAAPPATAPLTASAPPSSGVRSGSAFLATYCEKCHGAAKQKGKLRVDSMAALLKGGASGAALVPGKPEQSSLVQRTRLALDNDEHMPPAKEPQPSAAEIAVLAAWVRSGASTPVAAPTPTTLPTTAPPASSSPPVAAEEPAPTTPPAPAPPAPDAPDAAQLASLPADVPLFSAAVQPLLREKCGKCHIRDKPAGGLAVAEHAQLIEGGFSGPGVVPKNRAASVLMQRLVLPPNDDEHMPPEDEPTLSADQVELVGAWIDQGAPGTGTTRTSALTAGAQRALSALGLKPGVTVAAAASTPQTLPPQSGGCGACSVPGVQRSPLSLALQVTALLGAGLVLRSRRSRTRKNPRVRINIG